MPWVPLVDADAVQPGEVAGAEVGPLEVVVWRSSSGEVAVCDARCPHQWSHLAAVGVVDGEELVCASHLWRFDGAGGGSKVNVKGRRDPKGPVATFPCRVRAGRVEALVPSEVDEAQPG